MKKLKFAKGADSKHSSHAKPAQSKNPKSGLRRLSSGWQLYLTSLRAYFADWRLYTKVLAIVAIPTDLLSLSQSLSANSSFTDYTSMAAIVMNVASLWTIIRRREGGLSSTLAEAYYDGNVALIRYLLVSVLIVLMLIPLALGLALYGASLYVPGAAPLSPVGLLIAAAAILLALPTFYMLIRFGFAPIIVVRDGLRPVASLRRSWRVTRGHLWGVAGRLLLLIVFLAITSIPATIVTVVFSLFGQSNLATVSFEILATLTALPILNLYQLELYRELEAIAPAAPTEAAAEADFGDKPEAAQLEPIPESEGESGDRERESPDAPAGAPA